MWVQQQPSGRAWRGFYRDANGRQRSKSFQYEYQAEAWAKAEERAALGEQPAVAAELQPAELVGITVREFGERWIGRLTGIRPQTRSNYRVPLGRIQTDLGDLPLAGLTRGVVREWVAGMEQDGTGPAARNYAVKVLRMMCKSARVDEEPALLAADPTEGIRRLKPLLKSRRQYLSPEQLDDLLDAAERLDWINTPNGGRRVQAPAPGMLRLAILLGVDAGLRWEEIAALDLASIVTSGSKVKLYIHRTSDRKGRIVNTTKNGEPRDIPVATERLRKALAIRAREARLQFGPDALLISRPDGSTARYEHWQRVLLMGAVKSAGIFPEPQGWHDLRHTYGSVLAEDGTPTKMISTLMGHAEEEITQIYMHASSDAILRTAVERALAGR